MITMFSMLCSTRFLRASIIALALAAGLAGCSALRLVYSQADEVAYWWLDGYVDFDDGQSPVARKAIASWFAWHRRTQLPDYAALLGRAAIDVGQDMTPAQACGWFEQMRSRADAAVEQLLPDAAALAASLTPEQTAHLQRKQAKTNKEFRDDFLQPDGAERLRKSVDRAVDRIEQLYGRLSDTQRQQVRQRVAASPFDAAAWGAERERRQRDLLQTLAQLHSSPAGVGGGTALLRGYWQRSTSQSPDVAYAAYQQRLEAYNCEFFAEFHNQTSPEQRREAQRRLRGWESDFLRLSAAS
jgi:Family of unknown function (DUF6279)